jgi:hypothetical protein
MSEDEFQSEAPHLSSDAASAQTGEKNNDTVEMMKGIKLIGAFHLAVFLLAAVYVAIIFFNDTPRAQSVSDILMGLLMVVVFFFEVLAVVQFVYVLPAIIITAVKKQYGVLKGVVIAMSLTLLLAGGSFALCTAIFMSGAFQIAG